MQTAVDRPSSPGRAAAGWVIVAGLAATALLTSYVAYWERRGVGEESRELAAERIELLASTMRVSMQVLYSLQSLHAATGRIEPTAFARFARDARQRHPELQALEWAPRLPARDRPAFEERMRVMNPAFGLSDVTAAGAVVPAADRALYFPVALIEPLRGNERALGLDLAFDGRRRAALERARATRLPAATAPLRLAQEERRDEMGFLVLLPLYPQTPVSPNGEAAAAPEVEGFAVAVFRVDDLIRHAMRGIDGRSLGFTIDDVSEPRAQRVYGRAAGAAALPAWLLASAGGLLPIAAWRETIEVAGRRWQLTFRPEAGFIARHLPWQTAAALLGGLLFTALGAHAARLSARRRAEVAAANAALQAEVVQREQAVQEALAASRSKSSFLANMSHEIRTPMNAVLGYAQWLRRDARLDQAQHEAVDAIVTAGSHLMAQINEVLDFSKIESGRLELNRVDFDLNAVFADLEALFQPRCREKRLGLRLPRLAAAEAWVHGDSVKLQQILINLLGNAVRFTRVGEIALRCAIEGGDSHRFEVIDTGPGVAPQERERIFQPFYQAPSDAAQGGSGLGLAIARRQAEALGGSLALASEQGAGSVFVLRLPLPAAAGPAPAARANAAARWQLAPGQRLAALVVDDLAANRDVLARLVRDAGGAVQEAGSSEAALASLEAHPVDVIFLDMRMPGSDGLALLPLLHRRDPRPRVIAYTAAAFEHDRARFLAAGCDGIVSKPIAVDALFETMALVCRLRFERSLPLDEDESLLREPDYARLQVPAALLQRMLAAAELHSATVLKACLEDLRGLGPEERLLARQLRRHLRAYDMTAVARRLLQVSPTPLPAAPAHETRP